MSEAIHYSLGYWKGGVTACGLYAPIEAMTSKASPDFAPGVSPEATTCPICRQRIAVLLAVRQGKILPVELRPARLESGLELQEMAQALVDAARAPGVDATTLRLMLSTLAVACGAKVTR